MGQFHQFFTELYANRTLVAGFHCFKFLLYFFSLSCIHFKLIIYYSCMDTDQLTIKVKVIALVKRNFDSMCVKVLC